MPFVFDFDHSHRKPPMEMKDLLGGKGANLAEMTSVLDLPVPPGFTIATTACRAYMEGGWPEGLTAEIAKARARLEKTMGKRIGDADRPAAGVGAVRGQVLDARDDGHRPQPRPQRQVGRGPGPPDRRRAVRLRLLPPVRRHVRTHRAGRPRRGVRLPARRGQGAGRHRLATPGSPSSCSATWSTPTSRSWSVTPARPSPRTPTSSCAGPSRPSSPRGTGPGPSPTGSGSASPTTSAPPSTSRPWCSATVTTPRAPGVGFTRDPATGATGEYGDFLVNAQGEDVVAGIRNTEPLSALDDQFPKIHKELLAIFARLEAHYRDMCDTEFTIEQGKLWMLQTRVGKRTGRAALDGRRHGGGEGHPADQGGGPRPDHRRAPRAGPPPAVRRRPATRCWPGASAPRPAPPWAGST